MTDDLSTDTQYLKTIAGGVPGASTASLQTAILAKIIAAPATEAKQDIIIARLDSILSEQQDKNEAMLELMAEQLANLEAIVALG